MLELFIKMINNILSVTFEPVIIENDYYKSFSWKKDGHNLNIILDIHQNISWSYSDELTSKKEEGQIVNSSFPILKLIKPSTIRILTSPYWRIGHLYKDHFVKCAALEKCSLCNIEPKYDQVIFGVFDRDDNQCKILIAPKKLALEIKLYFEYNQLKITSDISKADLYISLEEGICDSEDFICKNEHTEFLSPEFGQFKITRLEKSALDLGEKYLVIGDDGLLYFE